jgi:transcriptional regulator with XRE-family HTH domain
MPRRTTATAFTTKFGKRLRELRAERGASLSQLAEATQLSKGHLSSIEQGLAAITIETVDRIAHGLALAPLHLLAFPKEDEYARVVELLRKLPKGELSRVRRELRARIATLAKKR